MALSLSDLREDALAGLAEGLARFRADAPRDALLAEVEEICLHAQVMAASHLLVEGQPQDLFVDLCCAAESWRRLHLLLERRKLPPPPASSNLPLLGAIAADDQALAASLGGLAATAWQPGEEYQEDCDWAVLLAALAGAGEVPRALERLGRSGAGTHADHLAAVRALQGRDAPAFVAALGRLAAAREEEWAGYAAAGALPEPELGAFRFLWLEGLALLRLADRAGLDTGEARFPGCPPLARVARRASYQGESAIPVPL